MHGVQLAGARIGSAARPGRTTTAQRATAICVPGPGGWCPYPQMAGADLTDADMAGVRVFGANLTGANLQGATLAGAFFQTSNLAGADLSETTATGPLPVTGGVRMLVGAAFIRTTLAGTDFTNANLTGVTFLSSNTGTATMTGAFTQATWSLDGVNDFHGATWPAASCSYAPTPYGTTPPIPDAPCTAPLAGGGTVTFGPSSLGWIATLQWPTPVPSWWRRPGGPGPTSISVMTPLGPSGLGVAMTGGP